MGKIIEWKSEVPRTKFAPHWDIPFYIDNIFDEKDLSEIKRVVLAKEKPIIDSYKGITNDGGTGLGPNSLTSKFSKFNIFTWEFDWVDKLKESVVRGIKTLEKPDEINQKVYAQCWANVMRFGEKIQPHWHGSSKDCYLGAHLTICSENTSTYYENPYNRFDIKKFENTAGSLTIFPGYLTHWTDYYMGESQRISLAMDLFMEEYVSSIDNDIRENFYPIFIHNKKDDYGHHNLH